MLPLAEAVTLAMNALCRAANSGLLSLEDLLPLPSLVSDRGDSEPVGVPGSGPRLLRLLRFSAPSVAETSMINIKLGFCYHNHHQWVGSALDSQDSSQLTLFILALTLFSAIKSLFYLRKQLQQGK